MSLANQRWTTLLLVVLIFGCDNSRMLSIDQQPEPRAAGQIAPSVDVDVDVDVAEPKEQAPQLGEQSCSIEPPTSPPCQYCATGYQIVDGEVTCACCVSCTTDSIVNHICPRECPRGYLPSTDNPCSCCEVAFEVDYTTDGYLDEKKVVFNLKISNDDASLTMGQAPPCRFAIGDVVVKQLLRLIRAYAPILVPPIVSRPTDKALTIAYNDEQSRWQRTVHYPHHDMTGQVMLPDELDRLDAYLAEIIAAARAQACK